MRIVVVALMTLSLALAGCADESFVPEEPEPCVVVDPTDTHCLTEDELANKTADQVAHVHDYWNGQSEIELFEGSAGFSGIFSTCDSIQLGVIYPSDGAVVFQGTGRMDVETALELNEEHQAGPLELWIRTAEDDAPHYVGPFEDGGSLTMDVNITAADLPHQLLSAWEFWIYGTPINQVGSGVDDCNLAPSGSGSVSVKIHKTHEPPVFPGHPDHWGDEDELLVMEAYADLSRTSRTSGYCTTRPDSSHPDGGCQMWWRGFGPLGGAIVPPDTEEIELLLTYESEDPAVPAELGLRYHGADTRTFTTLDPQSSSSGEAVFEIQPERIEWDGPYAEQSLWRFQVYDSSEQGTFAGTFRLEMVALKDD